MSFIKISPPKRYDTSVKIFRLAIFIGTESLNWKRDGGENVEKNEGAQGGGLSIASNCAEKALD